MARTDIQRGTTLPDAELQDVHASVTSLGRVLGAGPAIMVLYHGVWCPYCHLALSTYQSALLPTLAERAIQLIAISPQTPDNSLSMHEKRSMAFRVLSDPGNTLARHLGVLPMPTTLAVDANRVVRWIDIHPDYSNRTEPGAILAALDDLGW